MAILNIRILEKIFHVKKISVNSDKRKTSEWGFKPHSAGPIMLKKHRNSVKPKREKHSSKKFLSKYANYTGFSSFTSRVTTLSRFPTQSFIKCSYQRCVNIPEIITYCIAHSKLRVSWKQSFKAFRFAQKFQVYSQSGPQ